MNSLGVTVLLCCCLIAYGAGRPSDAEESEDVVRESKREKHYQQSRAEHREVMDDSNIQTLPYYGGGKGKYLIIHPSGKTTVEDHRPEGMRPAEDDVDDVGQEGDGSENDTSEEPPSESVSVNLPADNVSLAEAKPIGLAIAGVGGEASSKPVATAVVGPGGLAVAKPVATAIAGIPGAEGLVGVIGSGKQKQKITPPTSAKKPVTGKTRRSLPYYGGRGTMNWPTYPLYKIPESHNWGFILRPVYSNVEFLSY